MFSRFRNRQRGATFLGILIIASIIGFALYAGIRLMPLYLDYMAVIKAMNQTAKTLEGGDVSPASIRNTLGKYWEIDYIGSVAAKDIEITKVASGVEMRAQYRAEAPFIANVSLVVDFDKAVVISTGGGL